MQESISHAAERRLASGRHASRSCGRFQIVMGQKFEFDEATSEALANRVPLPPDLANTLVFDLRRYRPRPLAVSEEMVTTAPPSLAVQPAGQLME